MTQSTRTSPWVFSLLFLGFWLVFLVVFRSQPLSDPGALWHVKVGDWIFEHQGFPTTDPFTWSYAGQHWIPQQWGAECLMSLAHRIGFDALLVLMGAMLASLAAWMTMRFIDGGLHWLFAVMFVSFGMAVAGFHFYMRPHMFTIVLTAVVMGMLVAFDRRRIELRRMAWLIPLCLIWTNLHGGVLGGIFTLGLAIGGWLVFRERSIREIALLTAILLACLASTLANPFGPDLHRTWFRILNSSAMKEFVPEHFPLTPERTDGQAVLGFFVFYLFMLAGTLPKRPRVTWLIPLVWFALSVTSIRNGPLFCMVALVSLADMLPETRWFVLLKKYGDTFAHEPALAPTKIGLFQCVPIILLVTTSLLLQSAKVQIPLIGYGWAQFENKLVPIELKDQLQEYAKTKPKDHPIFNDANVGGFLIYFTPSLKIYMDDRFELYGDDGLRNYVDMVRKHPERIEELADRTGFDRALIDSESGSFNDYLKSSKRWREMARCEKAVLYERIN